MDDIAELFGGEVEEPGCRREVLGEVCLSGGLGFRSGSGGHSLIKVNAAVGKLAERSLSLQLCGAHAAISRYPIFLPLRSLSHCRVFALTYRQPPRRSARCQYVFNAVVAEYSTHVVCVGHLFGCRWMWMGASTCRVESMKSQIEGGLWISAGLACTWTFGRPSAVKCQSRAFGTCRRDSLRLHQRVYPRPLFCSPSTSTPSEASSTLICALFRIGSLSLSPRAKVRPPPSLSSPPNPTLKSILRLQGRARASDSAHILKPPQRPLLALLSSTPPLTASERHHHPRCTSSNPSKKR